MNSFERRLERLEFQVRLMQSALDRNKYPFTYMILQKQLTEAEYLHVLELCSRLDQLLKQQKAQGFVRFEGLLALFIEELNEKLDVKETIQALHGQGMFPELMSDLRSILHSY
ncbi:DUF1878 family protein [Bacillus mangrovi]|uniref:DUF1878 family protein n=1 Tax=Metabacillus mangrovi TaxID=1491830 RepID=A0A7X2S4A0_9BACI|nr:DUF1878 family protein [Metabacillus mangrovi]MTH53372.1 DUF1878 family protein [Metabacillus mangrovi]